MMINILSNYAQIPLCRLPRDVRDKPVTSPRQDTEVRDFPVSPRDKSATSSSSDADSSESYKIRSFCIYFVDQISAWHILQSFRHTVLPNSERKRKT